MAVNYAAKYADKVAERFALRSLTELATNRDYDFLGVKSVRAYSVDTVPLSDYNRSGDNRYGSPTELQDTYQELQLSRDRAFSFTIDAGNAGDQMMAKSAARALRRQIDEVIVPELDVYRMGVWANGAASVTLCTSAPTKTTIVSMLSQGATVLDNALVPSEGRTVFIAATFYNLLRQSTEFLGLEKAGQKALAKGIVGEMDGMSIVKVPDGYMPVGAYFIIAYRESLLAPVKLQEYKMHRDPPGINGALVEGRVYYDAFVLGSKSKGIYVAADDDYAAATPVPSAISDDTVSLSCASSGAAIYYTLDGSDPKSSGSAAEYEEGIDTSGWSGTVKLKAYARVENKISSGICEKVYTV